MLDIKKHIIRNFLSYENGVRAKFKNFTKAYARAQEKDFEGFNTNSKTDFDEMSSAAYTAKQTSSANIIRLIN